jgi:flagellar M-ring protein FliF
VRRLTAAVLINDRRTVKGKQVTWEPRTPDEIKRMTELAESAIGFDAARGDQVSLVEMAFDGNGGVPQAPMAERVLGMASQSASLIRYGTIFMAMLVFFFFVARPALRSLAAGPAPARGPAPVAAAAGRLAAEPAPRMLTPEQQEAEQQKLHAQTIFETVAEHVKREPAQSTRLLESWIRSE